MTGAEATEKDSPLEEFRLEIGRAAEKLQEALPDSIVTLVIRYPVHPDAFLVAGLDDLDSVEDVIRRAKLRRGQ